MADADVVRHAIQKQQRGEKLSRDEASALRAAKREREESQRWEYYRTIPKKHWVEMAGRQQVTINEHAIRYGLPIGVGHKTISLPDVVRALHEWFAKNWRKLAAADQPSETDPLLAGGGSKWLEEYRRQKARLAEIEVSEKEGVMVKRDHVRDGLQRISAVLRDCGEKLGKQCGDDARAILDDALTDAEREIDLLFGGGSSS